MHLKTLVNDLNHLKFKHENSLLKLIQKYVKMFDGTLGKHTGFYYSMKLEGDTKPYHD